MSRDRYRDRGAAGSGSGHGPTRKHQGSNRFTPYKAPESVWTHDNFESEGISSSRSNRGYNRSHPYSTNVSESKHDKYADEGIEYFTQADGAPGDTLIETGTKLYISNLPYTITEEDIGAPRSESKHDNYTDEGIEYFTQADGAPGDTSIETGTKLYISNLAHTVAEEDFEL